MRMTVLDARMFAESLIDAAARAEAAGQPDFDLTNALQAMDDKARAELHSAIEYVRSGNVRR